MQCFDADDSHMTDKFLGTIPLGLENLDVNMNELLTRSHYIPINNKEVITPFIISFYWFNIQCVAFIVPGINRLY